MKVLVLMGGKTPEHAISLISGQEVVKNLDRDKYEVKSVVIPRKGKGWFPKNFPPVDAVFIAMHGPYGEDGTVQGMLSMMGIPYTGSGVLASALGMNKLMFRELMQHFRIPIPEYVVLKKGERLPSLTRALGKLPYFVKPHNQGSSVGASIVTRKPDLGKALELAFKYSEIGLIDKYIVGTEVTCAVLGNKRPRALPIVEIIPRSGFFDYHAKYDKGGSEEITPARISENLTREVQKIAVEVYKTVGCRGFARVDFILKDGKKPIVLEINTIPGLTPMSLVPKAAAAAGISYPKLVDKIIQYALE